MFHKRGSWLEWNPYREWHSMRNGLFGDILGAGNAYPINIWNGEDGYVFTSEMPGLDQKSINIEVVDDQLTIEAEKKSEASKGARVQRKERRKEKVNQSYKLPFAIAKEKVVAKYRNGILKLILPKSEESKAKKITIES
ncbi:MAG: Hsp20/alpha crystallin family protein [Victivallales bacterium]|nr:Hsp20/alpha crystallin family protein [Victivallales bacterium]